MFFFQFLCSGIPDLALGILKMLICVCWTLDVSRTASYEISLVRLSARCPSVRPSVRPSLSFLKIGPLVFSDIVHDDS